MPNIYRINMKYIERKMDVKKKKMEKKIRIQTKFIKLEISMRHETIQ